MPGESPQQLLQRRTAAHYDAFPFEFMTPEDEAGIEKLQPRPFLRFVESHARPGMSVGDLGCGPGRATMYLTRKELEVTAFDLSRTSLALARRRAPRARFVQGSNLDLPFADESFDLVVSDGVIHHTPDAYRAFRENVRVLKRGGNMYLGVYNRHRYYFYLYTFLGAPLRYMERHIAGRAVIYVGIFPLYYIAHLVKSRGKRTFGGVRNFFYDYIMTPRASFHSRQEIAGWAAQAGLELLDYDPSPGNVHTFALRKIAVDSGRSSGSRPHRND